MYRILLVEDDTSLGYILKEYLELHHFHIELVKDGEAAVQSFGRSHFDVCILDVMLPKKDGFAVAYEIKQLNEKVPVIFLTAKSLKIDKLKGFNLGADDYMVKPVDEEELIARIRAVMRRVSPKEHEKNQTFLIGKYIFDPANQILQSGDKKQLVTVREAAVLKLLCEHQGRILDRKQTLNRLWGESDYFARRSMDVFISHLRKYLADDPSVEIKNVHGKGYVLNFSTFNPSSQIHYMFDQILQLVKEHLGNNPQIGGNIPAEQADAVHQEIATHITNGLQNQPAAPSAAGGLLSEFENSLGSGNLLTSAISGGLVGSLASKFGLSPAITGAIAASLPGLIKKYAQKTNAPNVPGV